MSIVRAVVCRTVLACVAVAVAASVTRAQTGAPPAASSTELAKVFVDCQSDGCDDNFFRTELTWVNFVRDRTVADVFVLVTSIGTGSGGSQYKLLFDGQRTFAGIRDSLDVTARQSDTSDERRRALLRALSFGLLRYARATPVADRLTLSFSAAAPGSTASTQPTTDRWKLWVYSVGTDMFVNGDENYKSSNVSANVSARRITDAWKHQFNGYGSYNESTVKLSNSRVANYQHSYGASVLTVKSITPRLSLGATADVNSSKYENYKLSTALLPAVEYNLFPYAEAQRRQVIFRYGAGVRSNRYDSTTIFGKLEEVRAVHELLVASELRQKWGSLNASVRGNQYLGDWGKSRLEVNGGASWRIVRGLDFNVYLSYAVQRDQLNIPRGQLDDEDILIRQRQIKSGYNYFANVGLSYTFGSMLNNIVNPRFARRQGCC